jgi:sulfur carrier protein ThiS
MEITVRMFSHFQKYLPPGTERAGYELQVEPGTTVAALLLQLKMPENLTTVITVNDTNRKEDHVLEDRDTVKIFPAAMGG